LHGVFRHQVVREEDRLGLRLRIRWSLSNSGRTTTGWCVLKSHCLRRCAYTGASPVVVTIMVESLSTRMVRSEDQTVTECEYF